MHFFKIQPLTIIFNIPFLVYYFSPQILQMCWRVCFNVWNFLVFVSCFLLNTTFVYLILHCSIQGVQNLFFNSFVLSHLESLRFMSTWKKRKLHSRIWWLNWKPKQLAFVISFPIFFLFFKPILSIHFINVKLSLLQAFLVHTKIYYIHTETH